MLHISIPTPCHEDWNKMSPRDQGAFCVVCSKTIVDFTSLSDEQVKNYFLENQEKKTCGRFRSNQLTNDENYLPEIFSGNIPLWKKFLAAVVILFGSLLTGCKNQATVGKMEAIETNQTTTGVILTDVQPNTDTIVAPPPPPKVEFIVPQVLVGDIEVTMGTPADIVGDPVIIYPAARIDTATIQAKNDSLPKKDPVKIECDDPKKESLLYWKPE